MIEIVHIDVREVLPPRPPVLEIQGIPNGAPVSADIDAIYRRALDLLAETAAPAAIFSEITVEDFTAVYHGEGANEPRTPVGEIYPHAERLALFAATVGPNVSRAIDTCFRQNDLAVGAMLDAAASVAAERAGDAAQRRYVESMPMTATSTDRTVVIRYSPGYCGWHITAQRKLFERLHPERIGVTLRESCLMEPLKSISGVFVAGPLALHDFAMDYAFCSQCRDQGCRERIRAAMNE